MKTSFTQSNDDVGGRPEQDDTEISAITQTTRDNDNNDLNVVITTGNKENKKWKKLIC